MRRRSALCTIVVGIATSLAPNLLASERIYRIGFLGGFQRDQTGALDALIQGLNELGYIEGKNLTVELLFAAGDMERLPTLAVKLISSNADVLITGFVPAAKALQKATQSVPIVVIASHDGVGSGLYQSLARPGGNITGIESLSDALDAKRIEIMKQLVPNLRRMSILYNPDASGIDAHLQSIRAGSAKHGIATTFVKMSTGSDLERAFDDVIQARPDAIMSIQDPLLYWHRRQIVALAAKNRLPMANEAVEFVRVGQLFSYGANINQIYRRAASYVDRILKGANPGDLPVEQPTIFELAINLQAAKVLGIEIPNALLASADLLLE